MKNKDWKNLFGSAPQSFLDQVDRTLDRLEKEENMKKRYKFSVVLVAAALVVALAGVALAAGYPGLIDYLSQSELKPLEGADQLIVSDLGTIDNAYFTLEVREAVYDGHSAAVYLRITAKEPDKYALYHPCLLSDEEEKLEEYLNGRPKLYVRPSVSQICDEFALMLVEEESVQINEDGSMSIWKTGRVEGEAPEEITLTLSDRHGLEREDGQIYLLDDTIELTIPLTANAERKTARLVPTDRNQVGPFILISGSISASPISGQYSIDYTFDIDTENRPGTTLTFRNQDGSEIKRGNHFTSESQTEDDSVILNRTGEIEAFETLPEKILIEVHVGGENPVEGIIECDVIG